MQYRTSAFTQFCVPYNVQCTCSVCSVQFNKLYVYTHFCIIFKQAWAVPTRTSQADNKVLPPFVLGYCTCMHKHTIIYNMYTMCAGLSRVSEV